MKLIKGLKKWKSHDSFNSSKCKYTDINMRFHYSVPKTAVPNLDLMPYIYIVYVFHNCITNASPLGQKLPMAYIDRIYISI